VALKEMLTGKDALWGQSFRLQYGSTGSLVLKSRSGRARQIFANYSICLRIMFAVFVKRETN
jgi:hypothetical protein